MTKTKCTVQECDDSPAEIFTVVAGGDAGIPLEWAVCTFHARALSAGEEYSVSEDRETILLGEGTPLKALNFIVNNDGLSAPTITLILGHDSIQSQEVTFEVQPDLLRNLCAVVAGGVHADTASH